MTTPRLRTRRVILSTSIAALLGYAFLPTPNANAAEIVKANNVDALNTTTSWSGGAVPGSLDIAVWNSTLAGANTVALGADLNFGGLKITNPGGAVTITSGNTLTLGASGIDMSASTQNLAINSALVLGAAQTWNLGVSGRTLTVGGALNLGTNGLTLNGGTHFLNGVISGSASLGTPALTIGGSNSTTAFLSGADTFTGQTVIAPGAILGLNSATALGATGAGNETIVQAGGTLNIGGQSVNNNPAPGTPGEEIRIAGTGVGGIGALINTSSANVNTLAKVVLTADATISAGGANPVSLGLGGNILASSGGRIDVRLSAAPTAGQKHLDLGNFTLTKKGGHLLALVNADVSDGNIVVDEGQLNLESGTIVMGAADGSNGTITVNANGKLGFWGVGNPTSSATANITRPIVVNGGTIGDPTATSASQTVFAPISITGALNPNFTAVSTTSGVVTALAGPISESATSTITEVAKRGVGILAFSNTANSYDAQTVIYQGTLRATFTTALPAGGVPGTATPDPLTTTDTPLGTNTTIKLAGGTLSLRIDMANNNTQQRWDLNRSIVVDLAPGGMDFDRLSSTQTSQTDKHVIIDSLTFAPASAANGYSIGQNQLTFTQGNTHRLEIPLMTMNSDTVLTTGDYTITGDIKAAGKQSLAHTGGNTIQFVAAGTQEFNAFFHLGNASLRVGSGFGTPLTSDTVTVGTGAIYNAPNNGITFRTPTNIAPGQTIEMVSQRITQSVVNLEQFTSVPTNLRALHGGVLGVGNATNFGDIDLSRIGDGTFRIGSNFSGSGNGTITGTIGAGAGGIVRVGALGTTTISGTNLITGAAGLEVGSDLIDGGFRTGINGAAQSGTVLLTGANDYGGGTTVNRSSTLRFQDSGSLGRGPVTVFGTISPELNASFAAANGNDNAFTPTLLGGSTIHFNNGGLSGTLDVNRWGDSVPITLTNGTLQITSRNDNTSTTNEAVGAVTFSGGSTIQLNRQNAVTGNVVQLTVNSLTRSDKGTLELGRSGGGTGSGFGSGSILKITGATTPEVTNGMVAPFISINDNTRLSTFANYTANGFVPASYTNTVNAAAFPTGLNTGNEVVYVDFASGAAQTSTLGDNPVIYALKVGTGNGAAGTAATTLAKGAGTGITIRSGGLIISGDATSGNFSTGTFNSGVTGTAAINTDLSFKDGANPVEAIVNVRSGNLGILNGVVTAAGLTKTGGGTLQLTAANNPISAPVTINQGILELRAVGAAGTGNITFGSAGTQLNVRINGAAATYTNGLTVAQNIPIATLDVGNLSTASNASAITFNAAAANTPGLVLAGSPGTQGQTLTVQTNGNGTGSSVSGITFGSNMLNSFEGNVTLNITGTRTLTLNNNPTISGTNPVITKSGDGTLIVGVAGGTRTVSPGTQVVVDNGTLELRSVIAVGTGDTTSITLNRGTLNLRRDSAGVYGTAGSGAAYPVTINGNATISTDRVGGTATSFREALGKLTINNDATLTLNNGNGIYPEFAGAQLNGTAFITSNVAAGSQDSAARFVSGRDVSGGALVKQGTGHLHLLNSNNTYDGGTYIQQGVLRVRGTNSLGTGAVYLNPGGILDFNAADNMMGGQPLIVRSNSTFLPMISVNADIPHPTIDVNTTGAQFGIVGLSNGTAGVYDSDINLGALYGGKWSLGGVSAGAYDPRFTGASVIAGAGNLYRLGGGGTSFAMGTDGTGAERTNVLTGANNVRLGFDAGNILGANTTNFQFSIAGVNDFSGGSTVIHRGMIARLFSNNDGTRSGLSNSAVDVFGYLSLSGAASLVNATGQTNAVTLNPGSALFFDNVNGAANSVGAFAAGNVSDRWNDATPINLNGAMINLIGANNSFSSETVGDVTYSGGARIRVARTGTGSASLTLNKLLGDGRGNTLQLQSFSPGTLGGTDQIFVNTAPAVTNGMVSPSIINMTDNSFVTYGAGGFVNTTYDATVTSGAIPAGLSPLTKLNVNASGAVTLSDNPVVYALRTDRDINVAGPFSNLTVQSGGLIAWTNNLTIQPNLIFNDGNQNVEARMFVGTTVQAAGSTTVVTPTTATLTGSITANGVTKFGQGTLVIAVPQTNYASGWTVNSGVLQINDPQGLGQSVAGNSVVLNATQTTSGQAVGSANNLPAVNFAQTQLTFNRDSGSPELLTFSGGPITVMNEATIRIAGANDRNIQIPAVTLDSSSTAASVSLTLDVPFNRARGVVPNLTLNDNAVVRVFDSGSTTDTGRITAAVVNTLTGAGKNLVKVGNRTLELPNDNSTSFTGGSITVSQGTVRVRHNGSLGNAASTATIERNATLEIASSNFNPIATVTQLPGSIERWNVEDARPGTTYNLPAGVNLQLNTNLLAARTIGLNGGSLEGFLWTDHPSTAVERTVGSAVTVKLLADSYVGQNILQGQGYDAGRGPSGAQPYGDNITGAYLRIDGNITGAFNLTKTGLDTVTIAGTNNTYNDTIVDMGVLRIGATNALPTGKTLVTRLGGTFDLNGFDQTVGGLGTADAGFSSGGVNVGSSGDIVNSGVVDNTLTVNNSADYTYNGVIDRNVALTKTGAGKLTLAGANTYVGKTTIAAGTLAVTGSISGSRTIDVKNGATLDVSSQFAGFTIDPKQTLTGSGNIAGILNVAGVVAPEGLGALTVSDFVDFLSGSVFSLDINSPTDFSKLAATGVALEGAVNLSIDLGFTPAANTSFLIVNNTSVAPVTGSSALFTWSGPEGLLSEGEQFFVNGQGFTITYKGGTGNDIVLTAIPEPSVAAGLLGGVGLMLGMRRRRQA